MSNLISKCGIDCGTCPWGPFPRQNMSAEEFDEFKVRAKQVLGYTPIRTACVTCQIPDVQIPKTSKLPSRKCLIRQCVDKAGIKNCGYCSKFPCDTLKGTADVWNREVIETKLGESLSDVDYCRFVEPFEGLRRLPALRASLKSNEFVEPPKVMTKTKLVEFPKNLPVAEVDSFKQVHKLLEKLWNSSFGLRDTDTFAQHYTLEKQRTHVLRFLWIFGENGKLNPESSQIVVDSKTYLDNRGTEKQLAIWSFAQGVVFKELLKFGVNCERVALKGVKIADLITGTGYLRNKGWVMSMSFENKIGGLDVLNALHVYCKKLAEKFGKKGFQRFCVVDMGVLSEL
ncbi:MAG: DUF3795 domain-containing protein [Candidatus Bathyarchaeota archaeon]|nr:DUF3795 domain-containing protein [Candidatus Bathyarchaeum tardum]